ncbi:DUF533 domain-containing protein [Phenylobacterium terrae]|uniref:DUF533 domain-containing protein n=1 Tax=Phenylobacterium terrae TaxID=2665495 RepID=A0ABW4MYT2_9CAUL
MDLGSLIRRIAPRRPPDRLGAAAFEEAAGEPAPPPSPGARPGPRRELELTLARKVLEAHLKSRRSQMRTDPTDLRGVEREQAKLLIRAMAAAAHADGALDLAERERIARALASTRLNDAERQELEAGLEDPPCLETLLRSVSGEELATRFYAVSLAATEHGRGANKSFLSYIANRLKLPRDLVLRLNRAFDVPV